MTPSGRRFLIYCSGMKYLGIDFGTKRVGVAVSDETGGIAFPRITIENDDSLMTQLVQVIHKEKIGTVVVGDTRAASGAANSASSAADLFIAELTRVVSVPVERGFEAWSSVEASRYAPKGRARDDASAAAIILQRFLDTRAGK